MRPEIERAYRNLFAGVALQAIDDATKPKPYLTYSIQKGEEVRDDARQWLDNHGYGVFDWLDLDPTAIDEGLYQLIG